MSTKMCMRVGIPTYLIIYFRKYIKLLKGKLRIGAAVAAVLYLVPPTPRAEMYR